MLPDHEREDERMDDIRALLQTLDHPVPARSATAVAALARSRRGRPWLRWAAAVFLTLGAAGMAVAATRSSLPRWATTLVARLTGRTEQPSPASADSAPAQAHVGDRGRAGIAVAPGGALTIDFTSSERGGLVRVSLVERGQVVVQAPAGAATFTTDAERLTIEGHGAVDTFAIAIPRDARRVKLEAAGTRLLLAERGRVTASAAPDSVGDYLLSLPAAGAK